MHEIARHVIHIAETLMMAKETLAGLIQEYEAFLDENTPRPTELVVHSNQLKRSLRSQSTFLSCLHLRSEALKERLQNEINLVGSPLP